MSPLVPPLAVPLATAAACLLAWRRPLLQRRLSLAGAAALAGSGGWLLVRVCGSGIVTLQVAGWPAPFGITLVADRFSALLVALTGVTALAVVAQALVDMEEEQEGIAFHPLLHVLLLGTSGVFVTGDVFNLYVWFEVTLIASFALLAAGGRPAQLTGTVKYLALNLLASTLLLAAVGLLYAAAGTLNLAHLALVRDSVPLLLPAGLFLAAFGIKAALFPFFPWLPAAYPMPAPAVSALFAALLAKVGIYALVRLFTLIFLPVAAEWQSVLLIVAGLTMLAGGLGAVGQGELRHLLSFLVIGHTGVLLVGLGLFTRGALAGTIFLTVHVILVNAALFLVAGIIHRESGSCVLRDLGGLFLRSPRTTILFLLPALSQAEIPPFPGFWGKMMLLQAGLEERHFGLMGVLLLFNLFTLYALIRVWEEAFWKRAPAASAGGKALPVDTPIRSRLLFFSPTAALALLILLLGLGAQPLADFSQQAAGQLRDSGAYVQAVLEASR